MGDVLQRAARNVAPKQGQVLVEASSATATTATDVLTALGDGTAKEMYATFAAEVQDFWILLGDANVVAPDETTTDTGTSQCYIIPAGQERSWMLGQSRRYMRHKSAATGGYLRIHRSEK